MVSSVDNNPWAKSAMRVKSKMDIITLILE